MNFCVLGADAWGTALAIHLIRRGHSVTLVPDDIDKAMELASSRENVQALPGYSLPLQLQIGFEVKPVLMEADVVVVSAPGEELCELCYSVASSLESAAVLKLMITLNETFASQAAAMVDELLTGISHAVLVGLTDAEDLASGKSANLTLEGEDEDGFLAEVETAINQG